MQIKIIQGKRCIGQNPRNFQMWNFHLFSFVLKKTADRVTFSQQRVRVPMEYCQPEKLHWALVSRAFTVVLSRSHGWMYTWLISVSRPRSGQANTTWHKLTLLDYPVWPCVPRQTRALPAGMTSTGLQITSQKPRERLVTFFYYTHCERIG